MTNKSFKHIALISRQGKNTADTVNAVKNYLLKKKLTVYIEEKTAGMLSKNTLPTFSETHLPKKVDLMIVIGGDGSLLNAAHCALPYHLPVLGINRGRLGFLTDIHPNELSKIGAVLSGKYLTEKRFLLTAKNGKKPLGIALNDVVLLPGDAQLIEFEIRINDQFVCHQRADGLIVSTPTGSTAYALSGGGPILHPKLNAIVLVPMFPHTLSSRPIVVQDTAKIEIRVRNHNASHADISCDGQHRISIDPNDCITITKHKKQLQLIHPENYEYFATLREKLGWQSRIPK
ncbi:MAG: NAD(+) kinase [Gammaproteobacteria bacterium CG_4_10_14_0_8_um_filter_38_16]|nr:MAG: NAD(+) kinase [Gammaproteobacteria bacterium CG_4_10_14_0_8_um_filter_38_16]PJA02643.1 MAG: NAD(+) kinase [Gammaproteobacteria bacterium CG_4_10_14_0_2_um_filter_38_22]PJB11099.1 MAG: NAD(+) kinase [Gammaproteobacteria bacterium CG_4_9_14_3_um_filter_38_9]